MPTSGLYRSVIGTVFYGSVLINPAPSIADPLIITPPVINSGGTATVTGPGIQSGAKVLVWGGSAQVSHLGLQGNALDVAVAGNYAFVAADSAGLHVVDISDPANPVLVATVATNGNAQRIQISGNLAYVSSAAGGLDVIDISDPTAPALLTTPSLASTTTDARVAAPYAFVTNGQPQITPAPSSVLTSLALYVPLDDRVSGGVGTDITVKTGPAMLSLAEIASGTLIVPSVHYTVENNFGSNGGTMVFPGGTGDGPLIAGDRDDYKSLLNFGDRPAILSFWVDHDTSTTSGGSIVSAGPNGYHSPGSGGWSAYTGNGNGKVWFVVARKNSPSGADCTVYSIAGSMVSVTDGTRHHVVIVYDPSQEMLYLYTDGVKGGTRDLAGCRADTEGDDAGTAQGQDKDWFTIGEAGQVYNGRLFYNGSIQDLYVFTPPAIPDDIDAIVSEWYTLGMPGARAVGKL